MKQFRKLTAALCALCLFLTCFAGVKVNAESATWRAEAGYTGLVERVGLSEEGYFQITRQLAKNTPMGEQNSWTIFVYLCGSDLESKHGLASGDLQEMIDGSVDSSVRYVVLTGGSEEWQNEVVDSSVLQLYLVENGGISLITQEDYRYMNDPDLLYSFLSWGVANYPADKMGVIFWDHGGGSVGGVCLDEYFLDALRNEELGDDSSLTTTLTLPEISDALNRVYSEMTDQFEFIGFDACLMGTLETAFMLSSYARYMYGSEESEPGEGWDYIAIGQAIGQTGEINGAYLGKVVCDSFYESCDRVDQAQNATLSCIDLSKMNAVALAFDTFAIHMLRGSNDPATLSGMKKKIKRLDFFGGNSEGEGYYNLVDLADLATTLAPLVGDVDELLEAIDEAVLYSINGVYHSGSCGLSVYYPLHAQTSNDDLSFYSQVACSPYYYGYVAENAYAAANSSTDGYDIDYSLNVWSSAADPEAETLVEYYEAEISGNSQYVEFCDLPQVDEEGSYIFSLTDDCLPYIYNVEADIYFISDDGEDLVYLGSTDDLNCNWEVGVFWDNFDGLWFCLPDEQLISATLVSEEEEYAVYTTPVLLNDEESNLRFVVYYDDYTVMLDSVWSGSDEGMAGRNAYRLRPGDVIVPTFLATNFETGEQYSYYGQEYVYDGSNTLYYTPLFDAEYLYQFCIYDIFDDFYTTDGVFFTVEDGEIFFTREDAAA